jgi:hypothetical protein
VLGHPSLASFSLLPGRHCVSGAQIRRSTDMVTCLISLSSIKLLASITGG